MWFLKEITTPQFTLLDIIVWLYAWGITSNVYKTLIAGLIWMTIEFIIKYKIRNKEIKLKQQEKLKQLD